MLRTGAQFMIIVLIVGLFLMRESRLDLIGGLDESFADFLSRNSPRAEEPAPLTLIEINDESLKEHGWPWTPLDFALFFQAANTFQPSIVATDELLLWKEEEGGERQGKLPQYKKILREHILRAPKVLLGAELGFPEDPEVIPPLQEVLLIRKVKGDLSRIPEFTAIGAQPEEDFRLSCTAGFTNLPQVERAVHSVPLVLRYRGQVVPSFTLQAILLWEKISADDVVLEAGRRIVLNDQVDIPIDQFGRMRVDFGVPRGRCAFEDLVLASAQREAQRASSVSPDLLTGKLLMLARTDRAAQELPFAAARSGSRGELFSAAIATIQSRSFMKRVPFGFDCTLVLLAVVGSYWAPRWRKSAVWSGGAVLLVAYVLVALALFGKTLLWVPIILPAGLIFFLALFRTVTPDHTGSSIVTLPRNVRWTGRSAIHRYEHETESERQLERS
jgi:hypothetical protein